MSGGCISFSSLDDLPPEAAKDKKRFQSIGTKSKIIITYHIAGKAIAGMTFSTIKQERKFPAGLIPILKLTGEIITGAFYRMRMEEKYKTSVKYDNGWMNRLTWAISLSGKRLKKSAPLRE